jgi:ribosomal protein S12 methylthiotransferase
MRIQLVTLGCSKNRVDSEHLLRQLHSEGVEIIPEGTDPGKNGVDAIILNTCGFIKDAKQESIDAIFAAVDAKNRGAAKRVLVFGCLSQRYGVELKETIPEVDGFYGAFDQHSVVAALGVLWKPGLSNLRYLTTPSHYAYLKISEGCDRLCAFCSIPLIRGPHKSVPEENLLEEAESLAASGVKELILVAQDTTYYGADIYKKRTIAALMERLSLVRGIEWIRLHYSYPSAFPEDLLRLMASEPKICNYMDIPLQHVSDKVLAMMKRNITGDETRRVVEKFREMVPGIAIRTTMIVGHPGEDKKAFNELIDFVKAVKFERLGAFTYSKEEGTYGAINYRDTIPQRVKDERYEQLMEVQSKISLEFNLSRIGSKERVIIDSYDGKVYTARSMKESPEVDGEILIGSGSTISGMKNNKIIGTFANVLIEHADDYDLLARFV